MKLQSSLVCLKKAQAKGYAIGAFNVENMEMAQAVIAAAEQMRSPVILQTTPGTLKYAAPKVFYGIVSQLADRASVPVILHLDHGNSFSLVEAAIEANYTSVMIDGSTLPYQQNVALTQCVMELANGIPVEAELGTVGGKEDGHSAAVQYTDPSQARDFVESTGVQSFAPAIGTAHGIYKSEPKLDVDRLSDIQKMVKVPLVLHGTSGVPEEQVKECIRRGICKVNYATELRVAFSNGVKAALANEEGLIDPKKYLAAGREAVTKLVCSRIQLCGSDGKA